MDSAVPIAPGRHTTGIFPGLPPTVTWKSTPFAFTVFAAAAAKARAPVLQAEPTGALHPRSAGVRRRVAPAGAKCRANRAEARRTGSIACASEKQPLLRIGELVYNTIFISKLLCIHDHLCLRNLFDRYIIDSVQRNASFGV